MTMENGFDLLEEKVKRAAELVRRLRKENANLAEQIGEHKKKAHDLEKRVQGLEKEHGASADHAKEVQMLHSEVKGLRQEREDVRGRIAKLVEVLEGLD
jgi:predicted RNase H-like nuclease (RuvC/YqgF family)